MLVVSLISQTASTVELLPHMSNTWGFFTLSFQVKLIHGAVMLKKVKGLLNLLITEDISPQNTTEGMIDA